MKKIIALCLLFLCFGYITPIEYPVDGYERTGIKRLLYLKKVQDGEIKSTRVPPGGFYPMDSIQLNLTKRKLPPMDTVGVPLVDPELQDKVDKLFRGLNRNYSLAVLEMTKDKPMRYAQHRERAQYQPGSVGKLVVLTSFFSNLCEVYPHDFDKRIEMLKNKQITAGQWAMHDHHTIPVYDVETERMTKRQVRPTDVFSLYEWLDHMVSVSNNGAASVVWREAVLMHVFKDKYPELTYEEAEEYFKSTSKRDLSELAIGVVNQPLRDLGITHDEWRLGSFFTHGASSYIPGRGGSTGTTVGLMKFMLALEQGQIVDEKSSHEMKRLLYLTDRRIRYAASKKLSDAAVYFKSGSLYKCDREKNPNCGKYQGNVYNYMNSVAIIEQPDGVKYMVALMSNVHGKNSAYDHLMLASKIDNLIRPEEEG